MAAVAALVLSGTPAGAQASAAPKPVKSVTGEFVVMFDKGAREEAVKSIKEVGGRILKENKAIESALVRIGESGAAEELAKADGIAGIAANKSIGMAPKARAKNPAPRFDEDLKEASGPKSSPRKPVKTGAKAEPLAGRQWDKAMIGATVNGSYSKDRGSHAVRVAIIDTGVAGDHPDIAPNFDSKLSRNFTVDLPEVNGVEVDGPCEFEGCVDPAGWDDNSHGTHVASIIGSPLNGLGVGGVAPDVKLVNVRAGQDSGYFFLASVLDAISYTGDAGIDVANMSFYIDPWQYNCTDNPADSYMERLEQRTVITATQRAVDYAHSKGVTLVAALGNDRVDLGKRSIDTGSPNFPPNEDGDGVNARERQIDTSCLHMPLEADNVIGVSSLGPSKRKAYYSNYGVTAMGVSSPGGDVYDTADNKLDYKSGVIAAAPENWVKANGYADEDGNPTVPFLVRDCQKGKCAYYTYKQGTSMASPNAAGVAALLVSRYGEPSKDGLTMDPDHVGKLVNQNTTKRACPSPRDFLYTLITSGGTVEFSHRCEGNRGFNGFYGHGIVNANKAAG